MTIGKRRPGPTVIVRDMELEDLARVYRLGERLYTRDLHPFLYSTWEQRELVGHFTTEPGLCLVAEVDGSLAGFIIGTIVSKASLTYGHIVWVAVDCALQHTGVGCGLFCKLAERMAAAGAHQLVVDTDVGNTAVIRFFGKLGFKDERAHVALTKNLRQASPCVQACRNACGESAEDGCQAKPAKGVPGRGPSSGRSAE
jgi:ribosomal protein S18 acetylase RimI-like enzyme